jgi:hypothetical protein
MLTPGSFIFFEATTASAGGTVRRFRLRGWILGARSAPRAAVEAAVNSRSVLLEADCASFLVAKPYLPERRKLVAFQRRLLSGGAKDHTYFVAAGATVVAIALSFGLMSLALRSLPFGTAYAVWTGIGATGSMIVGMLCLQ